MRAKRQVLWTHAAVRDLESIAAYVAKDSPATARKLLARLRQKAADLDKLPERGRVVPELSRFGIAAYRELVVRPYRIIYRLHGKDVIVLAAIDGRRDMEELLYERMVLANQSGK